MNKYLIWPTAFLPSLVLLPDMVLAHPGHDHTSETSGLLHTLMFISILAVAIAGVKLYQSKKAGSRKNSDGDQ